MFKTTWHWCHQRIKSSQPTVQGRAALSVHGWPAGLLSHQFPILSNRCNGTTLIWASDHVVKSREVLRRTECFSRVWEHTGHIFQKLWLLYWPHLLLDQMVSMPSTSTRSTNTQLCNHCNSNTHCVNSLQWQCTQILALSLQNLSNLGRVEQVWWWRL